MVNLLQILKDVLTKAGLQESNEQIASLLQNQQVQALEGVVVPVEISGVISKNVINVQSAKSNPEISSHFKKSYFDRIDSELKTALEELGLPAEMIAEIEKNPTEKRIKEALKKSVELKGKGQSSQDLKNLQDRFAELQKNAELQKSDYEAKILESAKKYALLERNNAIEKTFSSFQFVDAISPEYARMILQAEIEKALALKKASVVYANGVLSLKDQSGEMDFFDTDKGKNIDFHTFLNEVASGTKLLKVSDSSNNGASGGQNNGASGGQNNNNGIGLTEVQKRNMGIS